MNLFLAAETKGGTAICAGGRERFLYLGSLPPDLGRFPPRIFLPARVFLPSYPDDVWPRAEAKPEGWGAGCISYLLHFASWFFAALPAKSFRIRVSKRVT